MDNEKLYNITKIKAAAWFDEQEKREKIKAEKRKKRKRRRN
ncbi:hypothetical protein [Tepidibacillus marianensis]